MADYLGSVSQNHHVATLEGALIAKWREHLDITLEALGALCDPPMGKNGISRMEVGASRLAMDTLLKVVLALERAAKKRRPAFSFGANDHEKLATFFLGPNAVSAVESVDDAVKEYLARRRRDQRR